ncbi:MAG: SlyX family protein [Phyllobacteriaceae bacterium]|nr:SlyX family protein [Phyllobacteriaceae bacterium]
MSDDRLVQLEIIAAEQERAIGELSAEAARQAGEIDELKRRVEVLVRRLVDVEVATAPSIPVQKPPHW